MNSDMAIVNLSRGLPASNRQTPGGLGAAAQGKHRQFMPHLPQNLRSVSTILWLQAGDPTACNVPALPGDFHKSAYLLSTPGCARTLN